MGAGGLCSPLSDHFEAYNAPWRDVTTILTGVPMSSSLWRLTVRSEFSAAHALRHYQGKCERPHGHNFLVEAQVEGETLLPGTEFLVDFSLLKEDLATVLTSLDHRDLNATQPFDVQNPSSENLSRYIYKALAPLISRRGVRLYSVTVGEKAAQSATYYEGEA
jgi:6-pyruvoyltetrahydropterin/6-carboxytetrahydropterin synthase